MPFHLTAGRHYNLGSLEFAGLSRNATPVDPWPGAAPENWFSDGVYRGADGEGIEPICTSVPVDVIDQELTSLGVPASGAAVRSKVLSHKLANGDKVPRLAELVGASSR